MPRHPLFWLVILGCGLFGPATVAFAAEPGVELFPGKANPFLDKYCNQCHNSDRQSGGVPLDIYKTTADAEKDRKVWEVIHRVVVNGEMPPKRKAQPTAEEKAEFLTLVDKTLIQVDCVVGPKNPGRVTLRRLNRAEYNNTIRDLCGVDFRPADDFPSDDVGYGFDNIGDVLSLPPILMEKYLHAADLILDKAVTAPGRVQSTKQGFSPHDLRAEPARGKRRALKERGDGVQINLIESGGMAFLEKFHFPADGEYTLRVKAYGRAAGDESPKLSMQVDDKPVGEATVTTDVKNAKWVEATFRAEAGDRKVAAVFVNGSADAQKGKDDQRLLGVERIEVVGPKGGGVPPTPESYKLIMVKTPANTDGDRLAAEEVLTTFARRAFRRPVTPAEVGRLMKLFDIAKAAGDPFEAAIKLPLKAVLVSPHFIFRVEADPVAPAKTKLLSEHELASRISYFLWSSMPDARLLSLADRGELRRPGVLQGEIKRMLADPRSSALVENFAGQWLQLRMLRTLSPDAEQFKNFDEKLRSAMITETELFFGHIVQKDRSILEFLDADYTFVNDRLSWHYGIPDVKGPEFRYVKLSDKEKKRGGIVTQASVLTVTSNPTRTSPVKRGKWIYENILGLQPPEVPPGVPELPKGKLKGTLRQQMEQHRADPACAGCHAKLDPLGFGLENFDAVGGYRWQDNKITIDASGVLPDGAKFNGPAELRKVLLAKSDLFRKCLAEKLLTYALGRGLEYYDKCLLDEVGLKVKSNGDKFSALVLAIVESDAFQKRKGN